MTRFRALGATAVVLALAISALAASPAEAATSASFTFTSKYAMIDGYLPSFEPKGEIRGSGSSVTIESYYNMFRGTKAPIVTVQIKTTGGWKALKGATVKPTGDGSVRSKLPAYKVPASVAVQKVQYRFKSAKSKSHRIAKTTYSKPFKVTFDNQALYTGLQARVYAAIKPYCSTTAIRLDSSLNSGDRDGEWNALKSIAIDPVVDTYTDAQVAFVGLHECAHVRQFYNYGGLGSGVEKMLKAMTKYFTDDADPSITDPSLQVTDIDPMEHAADCAATSVVPGTDLGYGGYCNAAELAAGAKLLAGKKL